MSPQSPNAVTRSSIHRCYWRWGVRLVSLLAVVPVALFAQPSYPLEPFFGRYEGEAVMDREGELRKRDIGVEIKPHNNGFIVDWVTVTHAPNGRAKRKKYSIKFHRVSRDNIYASEMRTNMFGKPVPHDPLKGDPYFWAKVSGDTLTVYGMLITDAGGYEIQKYQRTLTQSGMQLNFSRVRDGKPVHTVTGTLKRIGTILR